MNGPELVRMALANRNDSANHVGTENEALAKAALGNGLRPPLYLAPIQQPLLWIPIPMKGVRSMDEMKIQSKFMTGLVSRIVKKVLRIKLGCEVDIQLNEFRTTVIDDKTHVHLDLDADLTKEELNKLLKTIGI